jgi:alpha-N-acetylglucosaminidase
MRRYKAFMQFGLKDVDIREFFNGPAYLTWSRGQSMQSVGSSAMPEGGDSGLPRSWMQAQWALQKQILARTRPLGIIGVLPAFQGNMYVYLFFSSLHIKRTRHASSLKLAS